jgi:hypothetical protein
VDRKDSSREKSHASAVTTNTYTHICKRVPHFKIVTTKFWVCQKLNFDGQGNLRYLHTSSCQPMKSVYPFDIEFLAVGGRLHCKHMHIQNFLM